MKKTYVLDTNVLLYSPRAINSFGENNVIIPETVLEELDNLKKNKNDLGYNARQAARILDKLRSSGDLSKGVMLESGGTLRVETNHTNIEIPKSWDTKKADNRIIQLCLGLKKDGENVCLITKDIFERIKADTMGLESEDFYEESLPESELMYTGRIEVFVPGSKLDEFYRNGKLEKNDIIYFDKQKDGYYTPELFTNEFLVIKSLEDMKKTALGRFDGKAIVPLLSDRKHFYGIKPKNVGQKFMTEALFLSHQTAPLVIIKGPAGTGKTLFSLAVGLNKLNKREEKHFRRILICRPTVTLDEEIGFLPGSEQEKLLPYMRPIFDNLEILLHQNHEERYDDEAKLTMSINDLFEKRIITTEAVAYLRGRSIVKNWVIIDEAQNLSPRQIKAIITRIGEGSKLILIGDPEQIDQPFLDGRSNGLCYAAEKMKGSKYCCQVTLLHKECERSKLALEAAERL
ncbi:PhoH family protein [Oceanirhabdus sp. W0125-5]|uniref:PhoH family protein n=1 Tax=Oceanirhabdus sp. W0125-5 TaxID=2999116 RepID=UPI0022F3030E|nr:PhoH family protein [Oceanirhabdus sp. W0125-5]WBW98928.1 PhoH family protein [Oceanirhabdus sp. W0125-5]